MRYDEKGSWPPTPVLVWESISQLNIIKCTECCIYILLQNTVSYKKYKKVTTLTYDIMFWAKRIYHSLVPVTSEPLDDDLHKRQSAPS